MFDLKLFLGFPVDAQFEEASKKTNPYLVSMLTSSGTYLQPLTCDQTQFLGKYLSNSVSLSEISNTETHLLSILKRIAPQYPFSSNPPVLIPILNDGS